MKPFKRIKTICLATSVALLSSLTLLPAAGSVAVAEPSASKVSLDKTYLQYAVVSELPVALESRVLDSSNNYLYEKSVVYSVTSGDCAEIRDNDQLYVTAAGEFTIRASVEGDATVYDECVCTAYALTFSDVKITSKIENVTVYTQPIELLGTCSVSGIDYVEDVHKEILFEVESGPAEIYSTKYLRFTGAGTVLLKAYSRYDKSANKVLEIQVTDPDAGKDAESGAVFTQGDLESEVESSGCNSVAFASVAFAPLLAACALQLKKRRK